MIKNSDYEFVLFLLFLVVVGIASALALHEIFSLEDPIMRLLLGGFVGAATMISVLSAESWLLRREKALHESENIDSH